MTEKRRGLGRGLGALIPTSSEAERPVDVFFPDMNAGRPAATAAGSGSRTDSAAATAILERPWQQARGGSGSPTRIGSPGAEPLRRSATPDLGEPSDTQEARDTASGDAATSGQAPDPFTDAGGDLTAAEIGGDAVVPEATGGLVPVPGARFAELPVASIRPNARQPRTVFDEDDLEELAGSIREIGVLQPIVVRPARSGESEFELIMGERRWRATQRAGLTTVPAIIRETEDEDLLRDALLENLHRSQLNALEEAAAYQQLLDDFGCTHEELATRISRSRPQISNTLRLLRLPPLVQRRVAAGVLSAGHARALLGLPDGAAIERLAQRIVAEGLSVRATEEIVALGGDSGRASGPTRRSRTSAYAEAAEELASRLSDRFETRVKVAIGRGRGRITVEFASVEDLNRILATLSPQDAEVVQG